MAKVKFFEANNFYSSRERKFVTEFPEKLEQQINDFIKGKTVVDIKYQLSVSEDDEYYSAMVIYDEQFPIFFSNLAELLKAKMPL